MVMPKSIKDAAILLDKKYPNWHLKINKDTLNMHCGDTCILGQVFGSYESGLRTLCLCSDYNSPFGYFASTALWINEINSRLPKKGGKIPVENIPHIFDCLTSLNKAIRDAGGTELKWAQLEKMSVAEFIQVYGPNHITFKYEEKQV